MYKISQYFPKPYERSSGNVKVILDLSNYATRADLKGAIGVATSNLAAKSDLASLKDEVDKVDVNKLKIAPAGLSKLNTLVDNDAVKKTKLVSKKDVIHTSGLDSKTQNGSEKKILKEKIEDVDKKYLTQVS